MNNALVTIIVPCYNMGDKIHRLLDSILAQTYKHLQLIIVNDGSTDHSAEVIKSYIPKFEKINVFIEYIYQENKGLGGAINTGLKRIRGDYFCWPDADDTLTDDSVEKKVTFMENHPEYGLVRSDAALFYENDLSKSIGCISRKAPCRFKETNLFEDYILEKDVIFCPGCHMIRTAAFKAINPDMDIFEGNMGQDYQLLLPMVYNYKYGYIDECLYNYIIYKDSMSRSEEWRNKKYDAHQQIIIETLNRIHMSSSERAYYVEMTKQKYLALKAINTFISGRRRDYNHYIKSIDKFYIPLFVDVYSILLRVSMKLRYIPGAFFFAKFFFTVRQKYRGQYR